MTPQVAAKLTIHEEVGPFAGPSAVLAATFALALVLSLLGNDEPGLAVLLGMPLVALLFKIAGLYDHEQLRIVRSTLDEAPLLLQLTGLYTLAVTILQHILIDGHLGGDQIAGLWLVSFLAIFGGRMLARRLAARVSP